MFWFFGGEAFGILAPRAGIEPVPPALEVQNLSHWITKEVPLCPFLNWVVFLLLSSKREFFIYYKRKSLIKYMF